MNGKADNAYAMNVYNTEKTFEISDMKDDLLTPNYVSLYERQATTIVNAENDAVPVLPATHLLDKISLEPLKPRRLTPINTNNV